MKRAFIAAMLLAAAPAFAADCPQAWEVEAKQMFGQWQAEFEDKGPGASVRLEAHPEFAGNFRGSVERNGERRQIAGDIDDGDLTLEETADGVHIAAIWVGEVADGSCGKEVRGSWKAEGSDASRAFILRKQ
jgi:hypothetical protein